MLGMTRKPRIDLDKLSATAISDRNLGDKFGVGTGSNPDADNEKSKILSVERSYATIGHGFDMRNTIGDDPD